MRRREMFLGLGLVALGACQREPTQTPNGEAPAAANFPDPAETIAPLYDRYRSDPAVTTFPTLIDQAPWSADLRSKLEAMMARSQTAEAPILDFDPFVNAQDWQISSVAVATEGVVAESHASVRARFVNGSTSDEVVYDLIWEGGAWRVDNIRHSGWDLRQIVGQGV
ncbi:MAG: DUF3828 domain-containing protein [Hyphomonadaceae bacterium]|nr:DUF3828 domain-containing protein [Hyphomonadaceae bacterium]